MIEVLWMLAKVSCASLVGLLVVVAFVGLSDLVVTAGESFGDWLERRKHERWWSTRQDVEHERRKWFCPCVVCTTWRRTVLGDKP
jgi:hypothetical protein